MVVWAEAVGSSDAMRQLFARVVTCSGAMGAPQAGLAAGLVGAWGSGTCVLDTSKDFSSPGRRRTHRQGDADQSHRRADLMRLSCFSRDGSRPERGVEPTPPMNSAWPSAARPIPASSPSGLELGRLSTQHLQRRRGQADGDDRHRVEPRVGALCDGLVRNFVGEFAKVAEFDASGALMTHRDRVRPLVHTDAFSMALNQVPFTFLMVGLDRALRYGAGPGAELSRIPFNGENTLSGVRPARYPRVSSSPVSRAWNVAFSGPNFSALSNLTATGFTGKRRVRDRVSGPGCSSAPAPSGGGGGAGRRLSR